MSLLAFGPSLAFGVLFLVALLPWVAIFRHRSDFREIRLDLEIQDLSLRTQQQRIAQLEADRDVEKIRRRG